MSIVQLSQHRIGPILPDACCFLVAAVVIGCPMGAVILRIAVSLFNRLASPSQVEVPGFQQCYRTMFASMTVSSVFHMCVNLIVFAVAREIPDPFPLVLSGALVETVVSFLIMSGVVMSLLSTTFSQAARITGLYLLISIAIAAVLVVLALAGRGLARLAA